MDRLTEQNKKFEKFLNYFLTFMIAYVVGYICGLRVQEDSDKQNVYNVDTCNLLFDQYENALRIAGNHYENYVLDVYMEGDGYEDSIFQADYESYLMSRDSINNIWESNR